MFVFQFMRYELVVSFLNLECERNLPINIRTKQLSYFQLGLYLPKALAKRIRNNFNCDLMPCILVGVLRPIGYLLVTGTSITFKPTCFDLIGM